MVLCFLLKAAQAGTQNPVKAMVPTSLKRQHTGTNEGGTEEVRFFVSYGVMKYTSPLQPAEQSS